MTAKSCDAPAIGGPCVLPAGHNEGQVDVPEAHEAGATVRQRVLKVVFGGMTSIDEEKLELGLTYCDDISPLDILDALGYEAPYVDLVIPWSRYVGE